MAIKLILVALIATILTTAHSYEAQPLARIISKRAILLEEDFSPSDVLVRTKRDYGAPSYPAPIYKPHQRGRVGPVYTFVKTDYDGNVKWGVRHRAGIKYASGGGGYH